MHKTSDPAELARLAIEASGRDLIGDALHVRGNKFRGATTRDAAFRIAAAQGHGEWLDPAFQTSVVDGITAAAKSLGHSFAIGPRGFARLAA